MAVNINVPSQVKTYANLAAFPATGALKTIYIAEDTNKTYRWTGSVYTEISASAAMTWGAIGGTLSNQTDLQSALDAKVPTTRTLTINGVTQDLSANRTFTISTGITIGSTAIASGVVGRVLFEGAGNVVQESGNLFWDNTNGRLGIGTSSPARRIDVLGSGDVFTGLQTTSATGAASHVVLNDVASSFEFGMWGSTRASYGAISSNNAYIYGGVDFAITSLSNIKFGSGASVPERMRIVGGTGNVLIGTTTDAGFRLDVNGTARVQGLTTLAGTMTASGAIARNGLINGTLVAAANNDVLVGLDINPTFTNGAFTGVANASLRSQGWLWANTGIVLGSNLGTAWSSGAPLNGLQILPGGVYYMGAGSGFFHTFRTNTNNSGSNRLVIGDSTVQVLNTNLLVNTTTDAGFRLDVNGTARVQGNTNISGFLSATNYLECRSSIFLRNSSGGGNTSFATDTTNCYLVNSATVDLQIGYLSNYTFRLNNASRSIGIQDNQGGAATTDASALLTLTSTTKGFLPPRMTTTQKNAIASPAAGLMVYDTTLNVISYYNGSMWI